MATTDDREQTLFDGVPGTAETVLFTCPAGFRATINAIHLSGDANGGTITAHLRPGGVAAAAGNALATALAVGAAANVDLLAAANIDGIGMKGGDVLSALQSSGTHITVLVEGDVSAHQEETTLFNGQPAATETTLYTCPAGARATIDAIMVSNTTGTPATITAHLRPGGAAAAAGNAFAQAVSVAANANIDLLAAVEMDGLGMKAGDVLSALQGTAAALTVQVEGKVFANA